MTGKKDKYDSLKIPARHTVRHYINLTSKLYGGDVPEWLKEYTDDRIKENDHNLPAAIECFGSLAKQEVVKPMVPQDHSTPMRPVDSMAPKKTVEMMRQPELRKSRLCPLGKFDRSGEK